MSDTDTTPVFTDVDLVILRAARGILDAAKAPHTYDGGIAEGSYRAASQAIFQALNVTNAYRFQTLTEEQLHGKLLPPAPAPLVADTTPVGVSILGGAS